ncbi:FAD binding domain-containing protein [Xylogone sp. PMI_703]|nr:FAD binding domain-containing protein [Xylogone sp. PMI_703]
MTTMTQTKPSTDYAVNGVPSSDSSADIFTDYLIVGTGPAGASLACFLAQHGLTGLIVSQDPSNADTPRAHITNMAALDCLRDIGVDKECYKVGTQGDSMVHTRWSNSMAGEEYARIYSWGNDPKRKGDYELASPSQPLDLPQTLLEPILIRHATLNGFRCRWDTKFVSFVQEPDGSSVTTTLHDSVTSQNYRVRSKYLFGADGARSLIMKQLEIPMIQRPGQGFAVNILMEADMAHLMGNRMGNLHWILTPDKEYPEHAWIGCIRMVKPWHEWLCIIFPAPGAERKARSEAEYIERVREFIGDDSVKVEIKGISTWMINETAAEEYSKGNVYCLGDAVHRHPPNHGLGSNTCIQDAHNLAWKVAYVDKGIAGKELLSSYSIERQPVGLDVVTQANASLRNHKKIWEILGNLEPTVTARMEAFNILAEDSPRGQKRRMDLQDALRLLSREEHGLGIEMNQRYTSSAVHKSDQREMPIFTTDPLEYYHPTTYPGARLPHVWLSHTVPSKPISTYDLAGKGRFTLFTGTGGQGWKSAAEKVSVELGVPVVTFSIGFRQEYEDRYFDWAKIRDVDESGCVLVRPDYFVAWRSQRWEEDSAEKLMAVMKSVLSRN